ncbi:MAG TPA: zf-HC2 domain-containing protein [Bryobacteraceae bacterium]|nr:zf-HC2 domain-containing protein [Bryobacteraceae bacterium]
MNCGELEVLLADYLDDTLSSGERSQVEHHVATCVSCQALLEDSAAALKFLKRVDDVVPPPELITRIAYGAPVGRIRMPFERQTLFGRLRAKWLQPMLQPRLAMGMAMTILSFAMLERCTGVHVQHLQAADLNPVRMWGGVEDRTMRVKDRAVKYYENLRWVYEIETRLKSLQDQQDATQQAPDSKAAPGGTQKDNNDGAHTPDRRDTK